MSALGRIGRADPMRRRVLSGAGALAGLVLADVRQALAQAPVRPPGEAIPAPVGSALTQPRLAGEGRLKEMTRMELGTAAQRAGWLSAMRGLFPDVAAGDRLTGINRADGQVQFFRNDADIGRVADRLFGEAFFGIWLDPRTQAPDLRRALLQRLSPGRPS